jgi:hypothetical protein
MADRDCEPLEKAATTEVPFLAARSIWSALYYSSRLLNCSGYAVPFRTADRLFYWERPMAFAYFLMAAGGLLTLAGWIAIALSKNALHSTAQI